MKATHKNDNSLATATSKVQFEDAPRISDAPAVNGAMRTTPVVQGNGSNTNPNAVSITRFVTVRQVSNDQQINNKPTAIMMSVNGKKMPISIGNGLNSNAEESLKNDIEGRLFVMDDSKLGQDETQSIIDSLEISLLDQDPVQKEKMIRDNIIRNRKGLFANDRDAWNAVAGIIKNRIFIYHFRDGVVDRFFEYGKEFSANGTRRICFEDYSVGVHYRTLREAVSIDGKVVPIMFCSPDLLSTLQTDIKGRLFKREDKGAGWKTYLNQCAVNSLELTDRENALIPTYIRENAHTNGGLLADDTDSWETIAKIVKRRILVYEQQQEYIQGFYEYGKEFSQNGTKRVCLKGIHYQKLVEIGQREENQNTENRATIREQQPKT